MRYSKIYALLLAAMMTAGVATTQDAAAQTSTGVTIKGSVYGGGNAADVKINTVVNIGGGNVQGNVYGGGKIGDVGTHEPIPGDNIGNYTWTDNTGVCNVNIISGTIGPNGDTASDDDHGNVFGGGKGDNTTFWCEKAMVYSTNVTINNGTVKGSVYGGGEVGRVETNAVVKIGDGDGVASGDPTSAPQIKGSVFGAGKGLKTHGYSALVRGNVTLTIEGNAKVYESVYGGGELASVGKHKVKTSNDPLTPTDAPADLPVGMPYTLDGTNVGECTVNIQGYAEITNNVFGAGQGVGAADYNYDSSFQHMGMNGWEGLSEADYLTFLQTLALTTDTDVNIGGNAKVKKSVYGGSENGFVQYDTDVSIQGSCEIGTSGTTSEGNVYGGGRGISGNTIAGPVSGNSAVTINGGTTYGSVYGGGAYGVVKENVTVNVTGGEVKKDVYGGGALANTNTDNWDATANSGAGGWATGMYTAATTTTPAYTNYKTVVNVLGGIIGTTETDANGNLVNGRVFGGGLGDANTPAYVYGDVKVNLNGLEASDYVAAAHSNYVQPVVVSGTSTTDHYELKTTTTGEAPNTTTTYAKGAIVNSVFAANNLNGTPKGNATLHVFATQNRDGEHNKINLKYPIPSETNNVTASVYDVKAVYGGGNLANYVPVYDQSTGVTAFKTQVIIEGCSLTSIETVYGGGNAAAVPETNVTVKSTYEIGYVFGGGDGHGAGNPGADVGTPDHGTTTYGSGNANTLLEGGVIHEVYGGSNQKGIIKGSLNQTTNPKNPTDPDCCELIMDKVVGAGKYADIDGNVNMTLSCQPSKKVALLFAGADEANVNGNITLNITNGTFGQVFGGNNLSGAVKGKITVNVEETGCQPIKIDELYLGGNEAAYSRFGYYIETNKTKDNGAGIGDMANNETAELDNDGRLVFKPRTSATDTHKAVKTYNRNDNSWTVYAGDEGDPAPTYVNPELNIISCTYIGNVFGGGWGTGAKLYADPTVNINMIPGEYASQIDRDGNGSPDNDADALGEIGNVYGGGNAAEVIGNTTVNIATGTAVEMATEPTYLGASGTAYTYDSTKKRYIVNLTGANISAIGANITGNVFGAGKGKHDNVETALVRGNANVNMAGGTVKGNIYGGGELSSVGDFTYNTNKVVTGCADNTGKTTVTISGGTIGDESEYVYDANNTIEHTNGGNVFAGGKGSLYQTGSTTAVIANWPEFAKVKETELNISGGTIMSNAYGGAEIGSVGYENESTSTIVGTTDINITGGTIGTEITSGTGTNTVTHYTFGSVFGGGYGSTVEEVTDANSVTTNPKLVAGIVYGKTDIDISEPSGKTTRVWASVYGGGEVASVKGKAGATEFATNILISGGKIGKDKLDDNKYVNGTQFGGATMGNVYGGGKGYKDIVRAGQIKGNTKIIINGGTIYHNVYGGGAYASVGDFKFTTSNQLPGFVGKDKVNGINATTPLDRTNTGKAEIYITGGTIGVDGIENGMVFGSSRGDVGEQRDLWLAWVYDTKVEIGDATNHTGPDIMGSVYGSGENGHVYTDTDVRIYGGTIGIYNPEHVVKDGDGNVTKDYNNTRGNVYGGGCGEDIYPANTTVTGMAGKYEPSAGIVYGTARVTMTGGLVKHNIYGAGALGSVGKTNDSGVITSGGSTIIAISGGTVGDDGTHGDGNVFGAARGNANAPKGVAQVKSTGVSISNGIIYGNVYGGGALGDVGTYTYDDDTKEYTWDKIGGQESGDCSVEITGGTVKGHVFGAGKGEENTFECEKAMVRTTSVSISAGTVEKNVYGGGEVGRVDQDAAVTVGPESGDGAPVIKGNVFGAGAGVETHGYSALVRGNTTVIVQGSAKVGQDVYGGGQIAAVGRYGLTNGMPTTLVSGGECKVTVKGNAEIGTDGEGHVFGAGMGVTPHYYPVGVDSYENNADKPKRMMTYTTTPARVETDAGTKWDYYGPNHNYVWEYLNTRDDYLNFLQTLALATDTKVSIEGSAKVHGSVYGGSKSGFVQRETDVKIKGGTILTITDTDNKITEGNVFGGGKGLSGFDAAGRVRGDATTTISGGTINGNVYGGGELGFVGTVTTADHKNYTWYKIHDDDDHYSGLCTVTISNASVEVKGNVFGASKGKDDTFECEQGMTRTTSVSISAGSVDKNVYGGGEVGRVDQDAAVTIGPESGDGAPVIKGNVFGAGAGVETHGYSALVRGDAEVIVQGGAKVGKNVYGGGEIAAVGRYGLTNGMPTELVSGGECKVTIKGNAEIGTISGGHVFGAGMGVDETKKTYTYSAGNTSTMPKRMMIYDTSVYKSGYENPYEVIGNTGYVWEYYPTRNKYLAFLQTLALATDTKLSIEGNAKVKGSVYGGSESGFVQRDTEVKIQGATGTNGSIIDGNIYGGGKGLSGFDEAGRVRGGVTVDVSGSTMRGSVYGGGELGIVVGAVKVDINNGTIEEDVYGGGALAHTNTNNWNGTTLTDTYLEASGPTVGASVVGYYTKSGDDYTLLTEGTAAANTTYYRKVNTSVNLKGGTMRHAYGGGLGRVANTTNNITPIEAKVYGDVTVKLNEGKTTADTGAKVDRVFGANNLNGSPQKNVTVRVYATQSKIEGKNTVSDKALGSYDVVAVYGGGNEAVYLPASPYTATNTTGAKTQVIIEGCSTTSIETVYGGGNAAAVPETNVNIKGSYEIGYLFGGGNGKDDTSYGENPGADVGTPDHGTTSYGTGNANTLLEGGLIHEVYGGSNQKGIIKGAINQITDPKDSGDPDFCCELVMEKVVGAGKYADIDGDVNMTLSCQPSAKVPLLFAGADEANVNGNITLNITNGNFGQVFGGNNLGGAVKGKITVNVQETGCQPIKIDELYLGGNEAAYSVFGYYISDETHSETGKKILKPRESATDTRKPVKHDGTEYASISDFTNYAQPELNIISCTYIGKVFGGGLGAPAKMYANPTVNVNMVPSSLYADGIPTFMNSLGLDDTKTAPNPTKIGIIGDVFGGGNAADIVGNTTVNIAVEYVVKQVFVGDNVAGYYTRSGAGTTADPFVYTAATGTALEGKTYYEKKAAQGSAYIIGSVFGGGNAADVLGNTNVTMSDGYVFNGIFGGGYAGNVGTFTKSFEDADLNVFGHTTHAGCIGKPVSCAEGTGKCTVVVDGGQIGPISVAKEGMNRSVDDDGPVPEGWVWGAGQGLIEDPAKEPDTHFKSYVGSTDVTIGGTAFVLESIIGGGEFGRVLGDTKVTITGNCQIGVGAGKFDTNNKPIRYNDADFINPSTATPEQINAKAALMPECSHFPYGKVIGGKKEYLPYDPYYDDYKTYADAHNLGPASTSNPSDGKTWIGCVFAGGSGYMPYLKKDNNGNNVGYDWCSSAGLVEGNTNLTISGGHILTNVYGGNEVTNVKGKCKITMTGGTIGVPRTIDQIIAHPLSCYLFGAGKGDQRPHFNTETNVGEVEINISGGIIYGSVFGGGEDGHVQRDVNLTIEKGEDFTIGGTTYTNGPVIGTWGTSYVDGNVFGGGRGFGGDAYTAGNVAGSVDVKIKGGNILGSIYGGGRLGSVGYGLYPPTAGDEYYGAMRPDNTDDDADNSPVSDFKRGYVDIEISGGTIGNDYEYITPSEANTPTGLSFAGIATWTDDNWTTWKNHNNIPLTEFDKATYRLKHTKGGNVFAGGMGRLYQLDGITPISAVDWWKLGCVKSTKLTIKGGTIKSCVYGGGELGQVVGYHTTQNAANEEINAGSEIIIQSSSTTTPTIGTEIKDGSDNTEYTFGSVFGGGYGSLLEGTIKGEYPKLIAGRVKKDTKIDMKAGEVKASIYGGGEMASVGESTTSGETTTATGSTYVAVSGGTIGIAPITVGTTTRNFGGATMGNVYGGGSGHGNTVRSGKIFKNTNVTISGSNTRIYHNIYGGGAYGTVGDFDYTTNSDNKVTGVKKLLAPGTGVATVTITGGTIGVDGHENGMVFGSSRGDVNKPGERDDYSAWVYDTHVTIGTSGGDASTPLIKGSVYGSGENGHTFNDTDVKVHSGTIGIHDGTDADGTRGNVYGGGCGTDKYYSTSTELFDGNGDAYNPLAGIVQGTATVTINGGHVLRNVYGAGAMGPVGVDGVGHKTTVNINGGRIGYDGNDNGNVYGGARGDQGIGRNFAYVGDTEVNINYADTPDGDNEGKTEKLIAGSVFGGGEAGSVHGGIVVNMNKGLVLNDVYGGGALADTNTDNWGTTTWADTNNKSSVYTTAVNLTGGTVTGNVYGGGLGKMAVGTEGQSGYEPAIEAKVYGNTTVELNNGVADEAKGCIVKGSIFGCNNMSGSPQGATTVHVYKTQRVGASRITNTTEVTNAKEKGTKTGGEYVPESFDVKAVYGGGNMAAYEPVELTTGTTNVIIDGCDRTSICQVYGGGNAAATPATTVTINGTYEIGELFGGGNGKDDIVKNSVTLPNPGANVGYKDYSEYYQEGTAWKVRDAENADTKEERLASSYVYGTGVASVNVFGGLVHSVFGGSNTKGNVRQTAVTLLDENTGCTFCVDEAYGGGKSAEMDAEAKLLMACIPGLQAVYGGAEAADVHGNVTLNITNGTFDRVFGGNNLSGTISGSITVNVEEIGCKPVKIGELYGGGNEAGYSVYGYDSDGKPVETVEPGTSPLYDDPQVNVMSFTSIGNIYGGGYGSGATMVGNPTVNINEAYGKYYDADASVVGEDAKTPNNYPIPSHAKGKMGAISNVFGGGNAAKVIGNTTVNIGTLEEVYVVKEVTSGTALPAGCYTRNNDGTYSAATGTAEEGKTYYEMKTVQGVDIRGNVYGGGNNAEVTGNTNVQIGQKK